MDNSQNCENGKPVTNTDIIPSINAEEKDKLSPRQLITIAHLVACPNIEEACKNANIARSTIHEWMQLPVFRAELDRQRKELIDASLDKLKTAIGKAVDKLLSLLENGNDYVSRHAACDILEYAFRLRELEDVVDRLEKVERIILERRMVYGYNK